MSDAIDLDADRKAWATLAARLAIAGHQAWRSDRADGPPRYFVAKWNQIRDFDDLAEVERFADRAGA